MGASAISLLVTPQMTTRCRALSGSHADRCRPRSYSAEETGTTARQAATHAAASIGRTRRGAVACAATTAAPPTSATFDVSCADAAIATTAGDRQAARAIRVRVEQLSRPAVHSAGQIRKARAAMR
jgi:hypothetical protein